MPGLVSTDFTGVDLNFSLAPDSDPLPAGLVLSSSGVLSGAPSVEASVLVVIQASNSHGTADSGFSLSVQEMLLDFSATLDGLSANPTYGPSAQSGVVLTAIATDFSSGVPGSVAFQWKTLESGAIVGATAQTFTPDAALFDGETVFCEITPAGYPPKDTPASVIRRAAPVATGIPDEQFWDIGTGVQAIDMAVFVTGGSLAWRVVGQGASINPATGVLSVRTESQAIGAVANVECENSGGVVSLAFAFHIEDVAAGPGPELGVPLVDEATNSIGLSVDEDCMVYWRRDVLGTNPDPSDLIGGGGYDSGSFAVTAGVNAVNITFAMGNDGQQNISFLAALQPDEPSLVRTVAIDIDTIAPSLVESVPAAGATGIATEISPSLTFSEAIVAGAGLVTLYDVTTQASVAVFDVVSDAGTGSGQIDIVGNNLTLRPSEALSNGRVYAVLLDQGAVRDHAGNDIAGVVSTSELSFSVGNGAILQTDFGTEFATEQPTLWASLQASPFNATPEHRATETWASYPVGPSDGGIVGLKSGNYPQLRFSVPVDVGKSYTIDADLPVGEGVWTDGLRMKIGSAIDQSDYLQIDENSSGQPKVLELRGATVTATTPELWFAIIVETGSTGSTGGNPAISMLRIEEV